MRAEEIADQCLYESGARGISDHAKKVALVGIMLIPDGAISMRQYRRRMKETYLRMHPECGSFFAIFVLPVLISLISNWIAKWILDRREIGSLRTEAFDTLVESLPPTTAKRISTSTPTPSEKPQSST